MRQSEVKYFDELTKEQKRNAAIKILSFSELCGVSESVIDLDDGTTVYLNSGDVKGWLAENRTSVKELLSSEEEEKI